MTTLYDYNQFSVSVFIQLH